MPATSTIPTIANQASCPKCHAPIPDVSWNQNVLSPCLACDIPIQVNTFPALLQAPPKLDKGDTIMIDGESSCFFHESKRAETSCQRCGRFLCSLCDMVLGEEHLCPACLSAARAKGTHSLLENRRTLWDSSAFLLAVAPILFWPMTILTAPTAVVMGIYSFKKPSSIIPRTRIRAWLAILLGSLQTIGWGIFFGSVIVSLLD